MTHGLPHIAFDEPLVELTLFLLALLLFFVFGRIAHELTHVLVANTFGFEINKIVVRLNPFRGGSNVEYTVPEGTQRWKADLVNISPLLIGVVFGFPALVWLWWTYGPLVGFVGFATWVSYTMLGAGSDILLRASITDRGGDGHLWHPTKAEQLAVIALGLLLAALVVGAIDQNTPYIGPFTYAIHFALALSAMGVLGMGILEYQNERPA